MISLPREYKENLIELILKEREFEKNEMEKKLIELIQKKKKMGKKLRNISGKFINKYDLLVKFKSQRNIETEINELDTVLISYEEYGGVNLKGVVSKKKCNYMKNIIQ